MSGKPMDEAVPTTVRFLDGGVVQMDRADYDRLTAAQQQGQAVAECHCATCTCAPGMTPAVRFDTSSAAQEGAVRDHLISLGWTPPGAQQPAADNVPQDAGRVAVHFLARIFAAQEIGTDGEYRGWKISGKGSLNEVVAEARAWLAGQQPAAVDEALSHADMCRLSRVFNAHNDLRVDQDRRINEWLGKRIAAALAAQHQEPKS